MEVDGRRKSHGTRWELVVLPGGSRQKQIYLGADSWLRGILSAARSTQLESFQATATRAGQINGRVFPSTASKPAASTQSNEAQRPTGEHCHRLRVGGLALVQAPSTKPPEDYQSVTTARSFRRQFVECQNPCELNWGVRDGSRAQMVTIIEVRCSTSGQTNFVSGTDILAKKLHVP